MPAPWEPSFEAAMVPRTAIEKPCPPKRMVAWKPEARLSCDGTTAPMMADIFGGLKRAIPIPMMARPTKVFTVETEAKASTTMPAANTLAPVHASERDPIRSDSLPAIGERNTISAGWTNNIRPVR